jgi:hypothetical protein
VASGQLAAAGAEGGRFREGLLIQPVTHHSKCCLTVQAEPAHEIRHGAVHVGTAVGSQLSEEPEAGISLIRVGAHPYPNINRIQETIKTAEQPLQIQSRNPGTTLS